MTEVIASLKETWDKGAPSSLMFILMKPNYALDRMDATSAAETALFRDTNVSSLTALLKLDVLAFLSHMLFHESLIKFLDSYCTYRPKVVLSGNGGSSGVYPFTRSLEAMDRKLLQVLHRLLFDNTAAALVAYCQTRSSKLAQYTERSSAVADAYGRMLLRIPISNLSKLIGCIGVWGIANAALTGDILLHMSSLLRSTFQIDLAAALATHIKTIDQYLIESRQLGASKSGVKKLTAVSIGGANGKAKATPNAKPVVGVSGGTALLTCETLLESILGVTYNMASLMTALGKHGTTDQDQNHPLAVCYSGSLTGLSKLGASLLSSLERLYEQSLANVSMYIQRCQDLPEDSKQRHLQTISKCRRNIISVVHSLLGVSTSKLNGMDPTVLSACIDGLMASWLSDGSQSWVDWFQGVATASNSVENCGGALVADLFTAFAADVQAVIRLTASEDSDHRAEYLGQSLLMLRGFLARPAGSFESDHSSATSRFEERIDKSISKTAAAPVSASGATHGSSGGGGTTAAVNAIKSLFPTYGALFIIACLKDFSFDLDRTIDALLSDNLSPQLARMDRTLESAHVGKASLKAALSEKESAAFMELQKERIRIQQREEEENLRVIREEYDDDYDDQFDDTVPVNVSKNDGSTFTDAAEDHRGESVQQAAAVVGLSKREARKAGIQPASGPKPPAINWDVKMRDMKRLNSLIKEEEEEQKFWSSIKNTNRRSDIPEQDDDNEDDYNEASRPATTAGSDGRSESTGIMQPSRVAVRGGRGRGKDDGGRGAGAMRNGGKSHDKAYHERRREQAKAAAGGRSDETSETTTYRNNTQPQSLKKDGGGGGGDGGGGKARPNAPAKSSQKDKKDSSRSSSSGGMMQKADLAFQSNK